MALAENAFSLPEVADPRWMRILKRFFGTIIAIHLTLGTISAYRAWYQVHSLKLVTGGVLRDGSTIEATVVSYARTPVDVRLELIQGMRTVTLGQQLVPDNHLAGYDPRPRRATLTVALTPELLARFEAGHALLRATATGRPQWLRLPPPTVCEADVALSEPVSSDGRSGAR